MGDSAVKAAKQSGFLSKALGQVASTAGGFLVAQGVMAIPRVLGGILSTSRDLELQMKKANIVFGEQIDVVKEWAKTNAAAMGLSAAAVTNLAARFGDILIPMGFARDVAAEMSTEVVGLAGALSEWSGGQRSAAEVADILAKAMTGEREALKGLGVVITEAEISAKLTAGGFTELAGAQLQQARATATQELIFEKSTDAQTAYADGAGTAARKQAELSAAMAEAKETISLALTPALLAVTGIVAEKLVPGLLMAAAGIGKFIDAAGAMAKRVKENKDLLIAFATVSLAAVLIPTIVKAVTALWQLHEVFQALAIARNISIFEAAIRSLTLPTIGLPALAIGAVAAGLAIFGLARHFLRGKSAADEFTEAQSELQEALAETERVARFGGLDEGTARVTKLVETYLTLRDGIQTANDHLRENKERMRETLRTAGPLSDEFQNLLSVHREWGRVLEGLVAPYKAVIEEAKTLGVTTDEVRVAAEAVGVPVSELSEVLFPGLGTAAADAEQDVDEFADASVSLTDDAKNLGDALGGVVDALSGIRSEISKLLGVETKEEAALRLQISSRELTIAKAKEWVRVLDRELTPAEEETLGLIDLEIASLKEQLDLIGLTKDVTEDYAVVVGSDLQPALEDLLDTTGDVARGLQDEVVMSDLAAIRAAVLREAVDKLRTGGFNDAAKDLEEGLLADLETLAGIDIETEVDVSTREAEQAVRHFLLLAGELPDALTVALVLATGEAERELRNFARQRDELLRQRESSSPVYSYQSGGIVPGPPGQPTLALVHGGERITPAASAGGGQALSVTVNAPVSMQDQFDWPSARRAIHQEVDVALDEARSQALRSGAPLKSEIG